MQEEKRTAIPTSQIQVAGKGVSGFLLGGERRNCTQTFDVKPSTRLTTMKHGARQGPRAIAPKPVATDWAQVSSLARCQGDCLNHPFLNLGKNTEQDPSHWETKWFQDCALWLSARLINTWHCSYPNISLPQAPASWLTPVPGVPGGDLWPTLIRLTFQTASLMDDGSESTSGPEAWVLGSRSDCHFGTGGVVLGIWLSTRNRTAMIDYPYLGTSSVNFEQNTNRSIRTNLGLEHSLVLKQWQHINSRLMLQSRAETAQVSICSENRLLGISGRKVKNKATIWRLKETIPQVEDDVVYLQASRTFK